MSLNYISLITKIIAPSPLLVACLPMSDWSTHPRPPHPPQSLYHYFGKQIPIWDVNGETTWCGNNESRNHKLTLSGRWQSLIQHWKTMKKKKLKLEDIIECSVYCQRCIVWRTKWKLVETPSIFSQHKIIGGRERPHIVPNIFFRDK